MSLTNIAEAFNHLKRVNPLYTGPLIRVAAYNVGSNTYDQFDVPQSGAGVLDKNFIVSTAAGREVVLVKLYGNYGLFDLRLRSFGDFDNTLYDGTNFVTDELGKIRIFTNNVHDFESVDPTTGASLSLNWTTFSFFIRQRVRSSFKTTTRGILTTTTGNNDSILFASQGSTSTSINGGFGTPSMYKNGAPAGWTTTGDVWNDVNANGVYANTEWMNIGVTGATLPVDANPIIVFTGRTSFSWECNFNTMLFYNADVSANVASINTLMNNLDADPPSGSVTFNDVALSNGIVDFFSSEFIATGPITKIEQVPINAGQAEMTVARDPLKYYFGIARGMAQDFTGTLTAVTGNTLSTGLDLTGVNIGGENDDHYIFRATAGAGIGEECTVLSRTGGDIVVDVNPGFNATTQFVLGRYIRGISRMLPKS